MLRTRVVTACVLLLGFGGALFLLPTGGWYVLCAFLAGAAAWEWGRLVRYGRLARSVFALTLVAVVVLPFAVRFFLPDPYMEGAGALPGGLDRWPYRLLWYAVPVFWLVLVPCWLRSKWPLAGIPAAAVGLVVLVPPMVIFVRGGEEGRCLLLAMLALAWVADIAAYFVGRAWGRRKLAPAISPGKTWEGAAGAAVGVMIYGVVVLNGIDAWSGGCSLSPGGIEIAGKVLTVLLLLCVLTAASILGDLFESLLKRQAGLKDSGNLLPGHGGILDRVDSQTATLPLMASAYFIVYEPLWIAPFRALPSC
jgi:phosphatidate cytidylyltransferase